METVEPSRATVGMKVAIVGEGLPRNADDLRVYIGRQRAEILSANHDRIEVRVPVLVRRRSVSADVLVQADEEQWQLPEPIYISPADQCAARAFVFCQLPEFSFGLGGSLALRPRRLPAR